MKTLTFLSLLLFALPLAAHAITPEPGLYGGTLRTKENGDPVAFLRVQVGRSGAATGRIYWMDGTTHTLRGTGGSLRASVPGVRLDIAHGWDYLAAPNYTVNLWNRNRWLRGNLFPAADTRPIRVERALVGQERGDFFEFAPGRANTVAAISLTTILGTRAWVGPERRVAFRRGLLTVIAQGEAAPLYSWRDLPPWPLRYSRPTSPDHEPTLLDPVTMWTVGGRPAIAGFEPFIVAE
jgi:hypothetical protein